jgi:hypothetical protein
VCFLAVAAQAVTLAFNVITSTAIMERRVAHIRPTVHPVIIVGIVVIVKPVAMTTVIVWILSFLLIHNLL